MNLADLRIAVTVAREGSLTAASERLGMTQPTLSKAIARLEREHKIRLFERLARGMRPTELGQAFLVHAQKLDLSAIDMYSALRDLRQAKSGVLRLGVGQGFPDRFMLALAQTLTSQGIRLELSGGMTDSLQRAVTAGDLELAIIGLTNPRVHGLKWLPLQDDPMLPMAPDALSWINAGGPAPWPILAAEKWIVPASGTAAFAEFEQNFRRHGLEPPVPIVASRTSNREAALAVALNAIVLIPKAMGEEPDIRTRFTLVGPVGGWVSRRKLGIVHRVGGYISPAAKKAIDAIREAIHRS